MVFASSARIFTSPAPRPSLLVPARRNPLISLSLPAKVTSERGIETAVPGGGRELAIVCDLIVAADNAKFGQPEIKPAVFPPPAITYPASVVGMKRAMEIVILGENVSARVQGRWGL